ncbi:preprotein translocase subunit SecD family protein [Thermococcus gorgonarius]|uniref:Protein-export membrane protein SecD n=1 Tax=Thermococcus gorgonarius TaxID=71997 RepID=A0A2Z2MA72_THEGO|nr:preprotein translocase subunit SecD [Thermococcus gorgonarius]ASJ01405.1 preprotein translocase subunit SecD [Thermococcus gorgonarius]
MAKRRGIKALLLNWRVLLLILFLIGSIAAIAVNGLTYGIDIGGGVALIAKPDRPLSGDEVDGVTSSLQNRLNTFGLKDISIETQHDPETGETLFVVKVANVTLDEAKSIKALIESQGVLYMELDGVVFATGGDVTVYSSNYGLDLRSPAPRWYVGFTLSGDSLKKFNELKKGKVGWPVDIFLDPPVNSLIVVSDEVYNTMQDFLGEPASGTPKPLIQRISEAFNITVVKYENQSAEELVKNATSLGKDKIIVADLPEELYTQIKNEVLRSNVNVRVSYYVPQQGEDLKGFVARILHLYGPYVLSEEVVMGDSNSFQLTGGAATKEEALQEAKRIYSVLRSGSLPTKLRVISEEYISPTLGSSFKKQALIAGLGALIAVLLVIYFHYRRWKIAIPVASTSLFEVIIILGMASLIHWNLDLPSIAGIIAAIGTGVDQQIVITDELLGGSSARGVSRRMGLLRRMARAFFVILASATTTIVAMSFLLVYFVGTLKGFAVTTILGVLIGVLITRPAYAEMAKYLLSLE